MVSLPLPEISRSSPKRTPLGHVEAVMGEAAIAWLDWRLKGDAKAAKWFAGKDCGLCRDARWTVKARGLD